MFMLTENGYLKLVTNVFFDGVNIGQTKSTSNKSRQVGPYENVKIPKSKIVSLSPVFSWSCPYSDKITGYIVTKKEER